MDRESLLCGQSNIPSFLHANGYATQRVPSCLKIDSPTAFPMAVAISFKLN